MTISEKDWKNYISKLSKLCSVASEKMERYVATYGYGDTNAIIQYAHALIGKYGEGSAELSAQMYEAIAEIERAAIPPTELAPVPSLGEVGKAINGSLLQSPTGQKIPQVVGRMVKQMGADTTLKNALRDGAEFAWIPSGDTCAFCIALASRGWQRASKKAIKNGHAEHIHSHCDCQYAVRFRSSTQVKGYNPKDYEDIYRSYEGTPSEKINAMRRASYQQNRETILEQKRNAYAIRNGETE